MPQTRDDLKQLIKCNESSLDLLDLHSESWQGEDRVRGLATIAHLKRQTKTLYQRLNRGKPAKSAE